MNKKYVFLLTTTLTVFILDQISKFIIDKNFFLSLEVNTFPNVLSICKEYNNGAAFSILSGKVEFLSIFTLLAILLIIAYVIKNIDKCTYWVCFALSCIIGGAFGNLFDRMIFGHVIDFLKLEFVVFPIFNVADIFINIGAIILIIYLFIYPEPHENEQKPN